MLIFARAPRAHRAVLGEKGVHLRRDGQVLLLAELLGLALGARHLAARLHQPRLPH